MAISQKAEIDSILTKKLNVEWIVKLKKINTSIDKIEAIKKKIFEDRVYNVDNNSCFNVVDYNSPYYRKEQFLYECKIAFWLKIKKNYYFLDLLSNSKSLKILNQITNTDYIKSIEILDGEKGENSVFAGFESRICGMAVIINSDSKKLKRKIRNVL